MKLTYLGTAAAEGWPALFCRCDNCMRALKKGGRNLRTRSQTLINDDLLLEFPADSMLHMQQNRLDFSAVKWLLITHSHTDHFTPQDLHMRSTSYYAHNLTNKTLELYGNEKVLELLAQEQIMRTEEPNDTGIVPKLVTAYQPVCCGDYRVAPLPARHGEGEHALVYLIEQGNQAVLYLHDTGLLFDEVYTYLKAHSVHADLISYDCTFVTLPSGGGHLGLDSCREVRKKLEEIGVSDANTVSVINHFSHNGGLIYDELVPVAEREGFITAYDGMTMTL